MKNLVNFGFLLSIFIAIQFLSLLSGEHLYKQDVYDAKVFCESFIPKLDAYKKENGFYPEKLEYLGIINRKTPVLIGDNFYSVYEGEFHFNFNNPKTIMGMYGFNSVARKWQKWS